MKPKVRVIILNWNQANLTIDCIKSVKAMDYANFDILVIDNASTDTSVEKIKQIFSGIEILCLEKNYKFAGAYNMAFKQVEFKDDYFLLLNNDTVVEPNLLDVLISRSEVYTDSILGPKICYYKDRDKIWYAGGEVDLSSGRIKHVGIRETNSKEYDLVSKTDYVTGCCMFSSKEIFFSLEGFDTRFNMYGEDVDFCLRAKQKGIDSFYIPEAVIFHHVSASIQDNEKIINQVLSMWKLMGKHLGCIEKFKGFTLYLIKTFMNAVNSLYRQ